MDGEMNIEVVAVLEPRARMSFWLTAEVVAEASWRLSTPRLRRQPRSVLLTRHDWTVDRISIGLGSSHRIDCLKSIPVVTFTLLASWECQIAMPPSSDYQSEPHHCNGNAEHGLRCGSFGS